jgi:hypothetical protein
MTAPIFYGIDPDVLYRWTPSAAKGFDGGLVDGAPVFLLAPLTEKLSLRVGTLRQKQANLYAQARRITFDRLAKQFVDREGEPTDEERDAILSEEIEKLSDKTDAIYSEEIQSQVLADCIKGWESFTSPHGPIKFVGEWSRDCRAIPAAWRAGIFYAIVSESAFREDAVLGFSSPQE